MKYSDLRDFIAFLEKRGELKRISAEVDPNLEMTEICDRVLKAAGTPERVALGMGQENVEALREVGELLAFLKEPEPPKGIKDLWEKRESFKPVLNMAAKLVKKAPDRKSVV